MITAHRQTTFLSRFINIQNYTNPNTHTVTVIKSTGHCPALKSIEPSTLAFVKCIFKKMTLCPQRKHRDNFSGEEFENAKPPREKKKTGKLSAGNGSK